MKCASCDFLKYCFSCLSLYHIGGPGVNVVRERNTSLSELEQYPIDLDHLLISPSRSRTDTLSSLDGMLAAVFLSLEHAVYLLKKACLD